MGLASAWQRSWWLAVAASAQGAIFGQPVGPEAPGYRRVVKRPMDLGSVAAKLQAGGYATTGAGNLRSRTCVASAAMCCAQQDAARLPWCHVLVTRPQQAAVAARRHSDSASRPVQRARAWSVSRLEFIAPMLMPAVAADGDI